MRNCVPRQVTISEKAMAPHSSTLAWKIPWTEDPGRLQSMASLRVRHNWNNFTFTIHFHALEKEMATHSSTLAWRIPWTEDPGRLQSMGSQRVGHDWVTSLSLSMGDRGGYSIDTLDKGLIHALRGMRLLRLAPNENLWTVYSWNFPFSSHGWPRVTETMESKTEDKGGTTLLLS